MNDDEVAVLDSVGTRVQIMDLQCHRLGGFSVQKASQEAARENGLALDQHGNVYVSYVGTSEVKVYNRAGGLVASFGQTGSRIGEFNAPRGLWIDASSRLYVVSAADCSIHITICFTCRVMGCCISSRSPLTRFSPYTQDSNSCASLANSGASRAYSNWSNLETM